MKNLIRLNNYDKEEILEIFKIAEQIEKGQFKDILKGKTIMNHPCEILSDLYASCTHNLFASFNFE